MKRKKRRPTIRIVTDAACPRGHAHRFRNDIAIMNPLDVAEGPAPGTKKLLVFTHAFDFTPTLEPPCAS